MDATTTIRDSNIWIVHDKKDKKLGERNHRNHTQSFFIVVQCWCKCKKNKTNKQQHPEMFISSIPEFVKGNVGMDQYLLIHINTIFRGLFTSINPSYFDVNYRGTRFWQTAMLIYALQNFPKSQVPSRPRWQAAPRGYRKKFSANYRREPGWLMDPHFRKMGTLWLCQNSYWKWQFIVDFPINNGDFP